MNYLILTPDGVGSTLLQRALTVYLNSAGIEYYNTHELLNGLTLIGNNTLIKDFNHGYDQSLDQIKNLLEKNTAKLVSRIADYHVYNRLKKKHEDYVDLFNFCNQYFDKILHCTRDPYEYALSWSIRKYSDTLNVYSLKERNRIHNYSIKYSIDLEYFKEKLNQYNQYQYWVSDNFFNTIPISYNNVNANIDATLRKITDLDFDLENSKFGISINQYSKLLYNVSLKQQGLINNVNISKKQLKGILLLDQYQTKLINDKKIINKIPIKMNTLNDKKNRIENFLETIEVYNCWASQSNQFNTISDSDILDQIKIEDNFYAT